MVARAPFLAGPVDGAPQLDAPPGFRAQVDYYRLHSNNYLLVKVADKDQWGWMRAADVLQTKECLKVSKENPVYQKVTLRNDWKTGNPTAAGRRLPQEVDFLDAASPTATSIRNTRISEIFFVFGRRVAGGNGYLLLGADPNWAPNRPEASIKGWVLEAHCTRWNSRVAVYYNQANRANRDRVVIFPDEDKASRYASDGKVIPGTILAQESSAPRRLRYDESRFPIVDQKGPLLKIAFIASGNSRQINEGQQLIYDLRNIQILFVIDATTSMQPYFDAVQQAIRESRNAMSPSERAQYHFAVAVYRDYADGTEMAQVIANFDDERSLSKLATVPARSNRADHDYPESVYTGIIYAVRNVKWNPRYFKAVVVIGDHGNHPTEEQVARFELKDAIEEQPDSTAKAVADVLDPTDGTSKFGPILFHAINVNVRKDWIRYNDLFMAQMDEVLDLTKHGAPDKDKQQRHGMGSVARLGVDDPGDASRAKDQVKKAIASAFAGTNKAAEILTNVIDTGGCGPSTSAVDGDVFFGTQACSFLMDSVKRVGWIPPEKGYSQISEEGWLLSEKANQKLVEPWVWMSRRDVFSFVGFLSGVLTAAQHAERAADVIAQTVSAATGDVLHKEESLADYVRRAFQLPFRNDMILRYTPDELQKKLLNERSFQEQFQKEIGRSLERLSLALAEQNADVPLTWDSGKGRWMKPPVGQILTEQRWAASLGLEQYGWFPLSYLPGGLE